MYKNKESYIYLFIGLILFFCAFFPFDFLDIQIGSEKIFLNSRALIILIGFFFIIFPPSEPVRISSFGKWIIDLTKSIRGNQHITEGRKDTDNPFDDEKC